MKVALVLAMVAALLCETDAQAQSREVFFGIGNPLLQYDISRHNYNWARYEYLPRCRHLGLTAPADDLGSHFQPHFVWADAPDKQSDSLIARVRDEADNGGKSIFLMPPLPWC
ncbi:hypothetical protein [Burkholderia gladioli]|uniref:hypothetical protein n=1 Tax=Burkholderia gladioli TaxID=28095 RepID=UPI000F541E96|nr:hypothetical protein [Burkholderia gladioli]MBU9272716.1 hypothetical protein [Burkholderia gladioli]